MGEAAVTTYWITTAVMSSLIVFTLWCGRATVHRGVLLPFSVSLAGFLASRVFVIGGGVASEGSVPAIAFSALNLVAFYALAVTIVRLERGSKPDAGASWRPHALGKHTFYFVAAGVLVYFMKPVAGSAGALVRGLLHYVLIGATVSLGPPLVTSILRCPRALKRALFMTFSLVASSGLLYQATAIVTGWAGHSVAWSMYVADIVVLVTVLAGVIASYMRLGLHYRMRALNSRKKMEAGRSERARLSSIAASIYEDSRDLIRKQKEQTLMLMNKAENLEKILRIGITIQQRHRLESLLQMIVESVRDNIGFKTVTLRLFNKEAQNFETRAWVGLSEEVKDTVVNYRIPVSEYRKMIEPRLRISNSYFIRNTNSRLGEDLSDEASVLVADTWGEIDMLIVPLARDADEMVGYLSVENPEDPKLSVPEVIESLENIATLAVIAIRNASLFRQLEFKNEKLRVYAEKLSSLNKLKSSFVATISHEFRTPLTSIQAYCDTLLKNAADVDRGLLRQFLLVIEDESQRLAHLINDILDFSQLESGAMKFERKPCDLNAIVQAAVEELKCRFEEKNIKLHCELPDASFMIRAEGELMKQLVTNLLHNAAKFTQDGGRVWLNVQDESVSVRITVEDDGIGIPDDQMEKIFEEFHQVDGSSTREAGGTGIGLAICKNVVDWHDGSIWVENIARRGAGRGARFVVVLPKREVVVRAHALNGVSTVRRFEIERFLELLIENVAEIMKVRVVSVMLIDEKRQELWIEAAVGLGDGTVEHSRIKMGEGIAGKVAQTGMPIHIADIEKDKSVARSRNEPVYGSKSFLVVPIFSGEQVIGVINIANPHSREAIEESDVGLLEILVKRIAVAIDKLRAFSEVSHEYERVREAFKAILETRRYIDSTDEDVIKIAVMKTADRLGLAKSEKARLRYVLKIYDLGLSKVGYHVIKKPGRLTSQDRERIEQHTAIGRDMLEAIEASPDIGHIVLHHHENYDGTGYPDKLRGDEIPVEARIIRVADSVRALISQRPYQRQYSLEEATAVLGHRSGSFFDPKVVDVFLEVLNDYFGQSEEWKAITGASVETAKERV